MWEGKSACRSAVDRSETCQRPSGRHETLGNPDVILKLYPFLQFYDIMTVNERDTDQRQGRLLHELLQAQTLPIDLQSERTWHVYPTVHEQCILCVCVCVWVSALTCRCVQILRRTSYTLSLDSRDTNTYWGNKSEKHWCKQPVDSVLRCCFVHWGYHWVIHIVIKEVSLCTQIFIYHQNYIRQELWNFDEPCGGDWRKT